MHVWLALRRLIPLLAVLGLALTPMAVPAAMDGMHASMDSSASHHAIHGRSMDDGGIDVGDVAMDEMPCCPKGGSHCGKGCPLMALCFGGVASVLPAMVTVPAPVAIRTVSSWPTEGVFASLSGTPQPEPPRA